MKVLWVILIALLVISLLTAFKFREIAEMKGHDGGPYFWWTFLLGPVGMMIVIALPDRNMTLSLSEETIKKMTKPARMSVAAPAYAPPSDELPDL